ncbi:MAG: hypothetical protein MZV63_09125 [Marinilabiliales bacterium]|nr:hypothetical protein [Marinilabiliales bacterium]
MRSLIADISWERTGSELIALLLESAEIKSRKPLYQQGSAAHRIPLGHLQLYG